MGCCLSTDDRENDAATIEASLAAAQTDGAVLVGLGDCRMCFEGQTSDDDPVVPLGCKCLGVNSHAHESCIRKWFPNRFMRRGILQCEVCKSELGSQARKIVMKVAGPRMFQMLLGRGFRQLIQTIEHLENEFIRIFFPPLHRFFNPGVTGAETMNSAESIRLILPEESVLFVIHDI